MRRQRITSNAVPGQVKFLHVLPIEERDAHVVSHGSDCWCEPECSVVVKHGRDYEFAFVIHRQERLQIVEQM